VLLARGITSVVELIDGNTGNPRTKIDIEKAAKLTTVEPDRGRARLQKWKPYQPSPVSAPAAEVDAPGMVVAL
jgi:hypothetical protein